MNVNPKFKLKKATADQATAINLKLYYKKERFFYGIGESIMPVLWDFDTMRPIKSRHHIKKAAASNPAIKIQLQNINTLLNDYAKETRRLFAYWEQQNTKPTNELFKAALDIKFKAEKVAAAKPKKEKLTLNRFITQFIEEIENGKRLTPKGKKYEMGTVKNYLNFKTEFNAFQKLHFVVIDFDNVDMNFYRDFLAHFNTKNYSPNTIGRHIKHLKAIMTAAFSLNLHANLQYKQSGFTAMQVESPAIYLNEREILLLENVDLSNRLRSWGEARDIFLAGYYVAQRFSDYSRLNYSHVKETGKGNIVINLIQKKTGMEVIIPLRPKLKALLDKYGGKLPKLAEQTLNEKIKLVGELAGINSLELNEVIRGGLKVKTQVPKYKFIQTHTARRSGATNMYLAGMSLNDIMKITGHKSLKHLLKYIKVSKEETADSLAMHPYFTGIKAPSPLKVAK